jgi:hypothetical protein
MVQVRCLVLLALFLLVAAHGGEAQPLVPAVMTFGDSTVDVGNNDYLYTLLKANFPPYGRDFKNHVATGRFCNGKLATDITGQISSLSLNDSSYPCLLSWRKQWRFLIEILCYNSPVVSADTLGFTSYAPAYLSPQASGNNLLIGANFASAGSGYYDHTALMYVSIF